MVWPQQSLNRSQRDRTLQLLVEVNCRFEEDWDVSIGPNGTVHCNNNPDQWYPGKAIGESQSVPTGPYIATVVSNSGTNTFELDRLNRSQRDRTLQR